MSDCLSPERQWYTGPEETTSGDLGYDTDAAFCNSALLARVWWARFLGDGVKLQNLAESIGIEIWPIIGTNEFHGSDPSSCVNSTLSHNCAEEIVKNSRGLTWGLYETDPFSSSTVVDDEEVVVVAT